MDSDGELLHLDTMVDLGVGTVDTMVECIQQMLQMNIIQQTSQRIMTMMLLIIPPTTRRLSLQELFQTSRAMSLVLGTIIIRLTRHILPNNRYIVKASCNHDCDKKMQKLHLVYDNLVFMTF